MKSLPVAGEHNAFTERPLVALSEVGIKQSPSVLAREYNMRNPTLRVTSHAVRKWMKGESMPAQDRLYVLAEILGTSPNWLRFGDGPMVGTWGKISAPVTAEIGSMLEDVRRLDPASRVLLDVLIQKMLKVQSAQRER